MDKYIHDNTDDEITHGTFLNAYLDAHGAQTVNLDEFRTLPSSKATGAQQIGRLTNLMQLTVNTSFYTRYRSDSKNPDFGDTFPQAIPRPRCRAIPGDPPQRRRSQPAQASAGDREQAGFHFAWIEQGGTSLYASLAQRVRAYRGAAHPAQHRRLRDHALPDLAGQSRQRAPLTDPTNGLVFPDLNADGELRQTNLIMPEPTIFPRPQVPDRLDHPPDQRRPVLHAERIPEIRRAATRRHAGRSRRPGRAPAFRAGRAA